MPPNPLRKAHAAAERANKDLARITARLGTKRNPRGTVLTAYRAALVALRALLTAQTTVGRVDVGAIGDTLNVLEVAVRVATQGAIRDGWRIGERLAVEQLAAYEVDTPEIAVDTAYTDLAERAVMSEVQRQRAQVNGLLAGGAALALILGDATRQGVLRPAPVVREASNWSARAANRVVTVAAQPATGAGRAGLQIPVVAAPVRRPAFQRQAVAVLDERTTDCCLRVHGQIVDMDEAFKLTGTPRYADQILEPPFHDFCRTVWVLYMAAFDDGITQRMRDGAAVIQAERAAGGTGERNPANAFAA